MSGVVSLAARVGRTLVAYTAIATSLVTFPAACPWMVALWLLAATALALLGRRSWPVLAAACVAILHPNEHGDRFLAEHVAAALVRIFGDAILAEPPLGESGE